MHLPGDNELNETNELIYQNGSIDRIEKYKIIGETKKCNMFPMKTKDW